jgi:2-polyprenyl-6-methoxyphenol hydroxylase-like FAD-dependent oxidoreductase
MEDMTRPTVLVSGASIAGPALAYWLSRYDFDVAVVEKAPALRPGGFGVDFRGHVHLDVLDKMDLTDQLRARQTNMGDFCRVDTTGRVLGRLPSFFTSGDIELDRSDISEILYACTRDRVDYRFGDELTSITQRPDRVEVTFAQGEPTSYDLVIGADGLHSGVRRLAFGPEDDYLSYGGYYVAGGFLLPNHLGLDHETHTYTEQGRTLLLASDNDQSRMTASFVWRSEQLSYDRNDIEQQKAIVRDTFAGMGWETGRALEAMDAVEWMYFDSVSQVHLPRVVDGRVGLLGDAGYGATMGGLGTGLAVVGAYVLASELALARHDLVAGLREYERVIDAYGKGGQKLARGAGPFLAPRTAWQRWQVSLTYSVLARPRFARTLNAMTTKAARAIKLKDYPSLIAAPSGGDVSTRR